MNTGGSMDLKVDLESRLAEAEGEAGERRRLARLGSWLRLSLFFVFSACWAVALFSEAWTPAYLSAVPAAVFPFAVWFHERHRRRLRKREVQIDLLSEKLARIRSVRYRPVHSHAVLEQAADPLDAGRRSSDAEETHYELNSFVRKDVDLVSGIANLRDCIDTTQTPFGFRRLHWRLLHPMSDAAAIRRRQHAVRELVEKREQRWNASQGFHALRELSLDHLTEFVREPLTVAPTRALERFFLGIACLPPLALIAYALALVPGSVPVLMITIAGCVVMLNLKKVINIRPRVYEIEVWCKAMERFAAEQERDDGSSELLAELRRDFSLGMTGPVDRRWSVLRRRIGYLHWGDYGLVSLVWNSLTLWDLHFAARIERSLKTHHEALITQASALGEWESLAALADYHEERGDTVFPEIVEGEEPVLDIRNGRHPYLETGRVVANDMLLEKGRNLLVITGSNMAGKSTYLKMIALHVILSEVGGAVRADSMRIRPVRLFTVIDVEDDLVHGFSYFRVEVDRVKEAIEFAMRETQVLGIFDELFRGTNSTERVLAGREMLRSLAGTGGLFLMATHDMEYTKLPEEVESAHNIHFTEDVDEKGVHFTYEVRPGPATVRNALRVLEYCGIPEEIIRRARAGLEG